MIEVIEQTIDRAKLDHDLIAPITTTGADGRANYGFYHKGKRGEAKGGKGSEMKRKDGLRITISTLWIRIPHGESSHST